MNSQLHSRPHFTILCELLLPFVPTALIDYASYPMATQYMKHAYLFYNNIVGHSGAGAIQSCYICAVSNDLFDQNFVTNKSCVINEYPCEYKQANA